MFLNMKRYVKGANFERQVKKDLEAVGYFVIRSAGSKGKIDLVAFKSNDVRLIQCKTNGVISKAGRQHLKDMSKNLGIKTYIYEKAGSGIKVRLIK